MRFIPGLLLAILLFIAAYLIFVFSGWYNVAASKKGNSFIEWTLGTTMDHSVEFHSRDIKTPDLSNPVMVIQGAIDYARLCVICHGAPGVGRTSISKGLNPEPPPLNEAASEMSYEEIYWIVDNGIRMTGMPSFGLSMKKNELWGIVASVKKFSSTSSEEKKK